MRTTLVMNMKGGTAKTMTVINAAAILCQGYRKHVLLIDADSQANLSEFLVGDPEQLETADGTADLLAHTTLWPLLRAIDTKIVGAQLLPADERLMTLDIAAMQHGGLDADAIRRWLGQNKYFDHCLIDCPPAFSAATLAACAAADDVIIPVKLDDFGLRGVAKILAQIRNLRDINPKLKVAGVLPTMFYKDDDGTVIDAEDQLRQALGAVGVTVFPHIRWSKKVDSSTFEQRPLTDFSPRSAACVDYRRFVAEYLKQEVA